MWDVVLALVVVLSVLQRLWRLKKVVKRPVQASQGSGWLSHAPDGRQWGHWRSSSWRYPHVEPDEAFDIDTTPAPPYRAFKYKHTVIMDARAMPWDKWIELDRDFPRYHRLRTERLAIRGKRICDTLPGADLATRELCLELAEFLVARYPSVYRVERRASRQGSWFNEPNEICKITIVPLNVTYDLDKREAMEIAGLLSPVDIAVMIEAEDSLYYMRAGMIALAGSWRFEDKIGKDLFTIHTTGFVPEFKAKLNLPMTRYHQRLVPESPGWRNNYTLVVDSGRDELAWATSTEGLEDTFDQARRDPKTAAHTEKITDPKRVQIRQERQTLRRLPRTGAVIFTVHSYTAPVAAIAAEPGVPGRLASAIASWKGEVDAYKNGARYKELLIPYLEKLHAEQVEQGLTSDPLHPGWQYPY